MKEHSKTTKIVRFCAPDDDKERLGWVEGDEIVEVEGDLFGELSPKKQRYTLASVKFLPPVKPNNVILYSCIYPLIVDKYKQGEKPAEPLFWLKPTTTIVGTGEPIIYPSVSKYVTYEPELAVVIKRKARRVSPEKAADYILGYTCANDVSARDIQEREIQFARAKGYDTFCPIGPWIVTNLDPSNLEIAAYLNGARRVTTNSNQMFFNVPHLLSFASNIMTLMPGDVISTGAAWVEEMKVGDTVTIAIEGIGELTNPVVAEKA